MSVAALVGAAVLGVLAIPVGLVGWAAIAMLLAAYSLAVAVGWRTMLVAVPVVAALFAGAAALVADGWWTGLGPMASAAMLVGTAFGAAVRARREAIGQESRRRIVEERLRIARDVHDLVAHQLAVVTVQAGVAAHFLPAGSGAARDALDRVRTAGASALDELGALLGVLRGADDPAAPTEPAPSLADLERLLDSFTAARLRVDCTVSGSAVPLPSTVETTAYRIAQEALTNAGRYGDGRAGLTLTYTRSGRRIEVRNRWAPRRTVGGGYGVPGMRERAATVGGTLAAGPVPGGEFVVEASLPVTREAR